MTNLIEERVALAREGRNPQVITHLPSGFLVVGDWQPLPGYCLLLADPVVESANTLNEPERIRYSLDTLRIGDALMAIKGAYRVNYLTMGDREPALHTHIIPRYMSEPEEKRRDNALRAYDRASSPLFDAARDAPFMDKMRAWLAAR